MPQGVLGATHTGTAFDEALGLALWAAFGVAFRVTCGTAFEAAVGGSLAGWSCVSSGSVGPQVGAVLASSSGISGTE